MAKSRKNPIPVQQPNFRPEDLDPAKGLEYFNQWVTQVVRTLNTLQGSTGRTKLPSGLDVTGDTVTGLGPPQDPTDAVSLGHANANYSPATVGPQLDLGGKNAMPGLTSIALQLSQGANGTITIPKITTSTGSITVKNGLIVSFVNPT